MSTGNLSLRLLWASVGAVLLGQTRLQASSLHLGASARSADANTSYAQLGPFHSGVITYKTTVSVSGLLDGRAETNALVLDVRVSYPKDSSPNVPVVLLLNGFQCRAAWYAETAAWLSSWNYIVLQYTLPGLLPIMPDRVELTLLRPLLESLRQAAVDVRSPLHGLPCMERMAVMGHSRGGKLAALHLAAADSPFVAAVLVDPVDASQATPESEDYPSGARALAHDHHRACILGAGITGSCNPPPQNYPKFYNAAAPGTWQAVVPGASHMSYVRTGNAVLDWTFARLCGSARDSHEAVLHLTLPFAVAWLEKHLRGSEPQVPQRLAHFYAWAAAAAAEGRLTFVFKPDPAPYPLPTPKAEGAVVVAAS